MEPHIERVRGIPEVLKKIEGKFGSPAAAGRFLDRWRFFTEREAKARISSGPSKWRWKGSDRRSLTSDRDSPAPPAIPAWAKVGSNSPTIRFGEYGTGLLSEDPQSKKQRYFPPPSALEPWAIAHGTTGRAVAFAIWKRGGIKPRRFLRDAAREGEKHIPLWLNGLAKEIEDAAGSGSLEGRA